MFVSTEKKARELSPSAKLILSGYIGAAYDLGNGTVAKFMCAESELQMARHIRDNPHPSVVPVLEVGDTYYIMTKGEYNDTDVWPSIAAYIHTDTIGPEHNVVLLDGVPRWIDLDGLIHVENATRRLVCEIAARCWDTHYPRQDMNSRA